MYGLSCAKTRDERQKSSEKMRTMRLENLWRIGSGLTRVAIGSSRIDSSCDRVARSLTIPASSAGPFAVNGLPEVFVACYLRSSRNWKKETTNAPSTNRDSRPFADATRRTRHPHDRSAPGDSKRDSD